MVISKQLYQLQEFDLETESGERSWGQMSNQLGESQALIDARHRLAAEKQRLDELKHQQRTVEWDINDLTIKTKAVDEQLYSGRIKNPKELSYLQHEAQVLKAKRDQLETRALEIMDQIEQAESSVATLSREFTQVEKEWRSQQQQLAEEIDQLQKKLVELKQKRQALSAEVAPASVELYEKLRRQKGQAVAKVAQGVCHGCRISLSSSEMQQVRGGNLVRCSSCGRILFLP